MSGRKILADKLSDDLDGWLVASTAKPIDAITRPTCVLWTTRRKRDEQIELSLLTDEIELWVLDPTTKPELIEDALDARLLEVIEALEQYEAFSWDTAERAVLAEVFSGWRMTITCIYNVEGS